jgi:hypothetical protein
LCSERVAANQQIINPVRIERTKQRFQVFKSRLLQDRPEGTPACRHRILDNQRHPTGKRGMIPGALFLQSVPGTGQVIVGTLLASYRAVEFTR